MKFIRTTPTVVAAVVLSRLTTPSIPRWRESVLCDETKETTPTAVSHFFQNQCKNCFFLFRF